MEYTDIMNQRDKYDNFEKFTLLEMMMKQTNKVYKVNKIIFEYSLFANFIDYLRFISLKIYYNNRNNKNINSQIFRAFAEMVNYLKIVEHTDYKNNKIILKREFIPKSGIINNDKDNLGGKQITKLYESYRYITEKFKEKERFKTPTSKYIYHLIRYTKELENLSFSNKISPSFHESFYTDLGESVFKLFNKPNYKKLLPNLKTENILDIGCGNGNFIDTYLEYNPCSNICGVERQNKVAEKLKRKYHNISNVKIINEDITKVEMKQQFDIINMSYMLFYLPKEQQKQLLCSASNLLSADGKITLCQYFPNIEDIQMRMSKKDNKWSKIDRYIFKISNSILYSEILLNDCLTDFDHACRFDEFLEFINNADLAIKSIEKADNNYYSFYFILTKKKK